MRTETVLCYPKKHTPAERRDYTPLALLAAPATNQTYWSHFHVFLRFESPICIFLHEEIARKL